jgi:hypothetical protein
LNIIFAHASRSKIENVNANEKINFQVSLFAHTHIVEWVLRLWVEKSIKKHFVVMYNILYHFYNIHLKITSLRAIKAVRISWHYENWSTIFIIKKSKVNLVWGLRKKVKWKNDFWCHLNFCTDYPLYSTWQITAYLLFC